MRIAVLISGRGSNLRSLLEAAADPGYPAEIVTVISNRPGAGGLEHATAFGNRALLGSRQRCGEGVAHV